MVAIVSLLMVLVVSLLITRVATIALTHTGLSRQSAKFQARSAFTGVGFTTSESERVVNHPVRRRILLIMMLVGNAGIVTAISTFILGFVRAPQAGDVAVRALVLAGGVAVLFTLSMSGWVDRRLSRIIQWALGRYTELDVKDYASLLHLAGDYAVHELWVREKDWMAGRRLEELRLPDEGVFVLGVVRSGEYFGVPRGSTEVAAGDTLILYGKASRISRIDRRRKGPGGQIRHAEAVAEQRSSEAEDSGEGPHREP